MTERERKILMGESIEPRTADENAYANVSGSGGGGGGVLLVKTTEIGKGKFALDKTWQEIHDAPFAVVLLEDEKGANILRDYYPISAINSEDGAYTVIWRTQDATQSAVTSSPDGYPALS